jgi:hypothetical protein
MLSVMFQGTIYYRDLDCFTHRRLDALLPDLPDTPGEYVLLTLTYCAERKSQFPLFDQVAVTGIACQSYPAEKVLQILNSGAMTLVEQESGQYEAILSLYRDYRSIGQTIQVEWWPDLHRKELDQ